MSSCLAVPVAERKCICVYFVYLYAPRTALRRNSLAGDCSGIGSHRIGTQLVSARSAHSSCLSACFKLVCNTSAPSPAIITHLACCMLHAACLMLHAAFRALSMAQTMSDSLATAYSIAIAAHRGADIRYKIHFRHMFKYTHTHTRTCLARCFLWHNLWLPTRS